MGAVQEAGFLQDGVEIDVFVREGAGDAGDNTGAVVDQEADVMGTSSSVPTLKGREGMAMRQEPCARPTRSLTTATAVDCRRRRGREDTSPP